MDAEVKFTFAIVKHNAPFQLAESLSPLIQDSFSNLKVPKSYACSRTKNSLYHKRCIKGLFQVRNKQMLFTCAESFNPNHHGLFCLVCSLGAQKNSSP